MLRCFDRCLDALTHYTLFSLQIQVEVYVYLLIFQKGKAKQALLVLPAATLVGRQREVGQVGTR